MTKQNKNYNLRQVTLRASSRRKYKLREYIENIKIKKKIKNKEERKIKNKGLYSIKR